jgi:hypothetical protein
MKLRKFNGAGHAEYKKFVDQYCQDQSVKIPVQANLLENDELTEEMNPVVEIESQEFGSRYEFGVYLKEKLGMYQSSAISEDAELWDWLALFFYENIRGTKDYSKFALSNNFRTWYRHLVRANWQLIDAHGDSCEWMLMNKTNIHGDEIEQLMARESIAKNTELLKVAKHLYVDGGKIKAKARGRGKVDGDINRFVIWVQQIGNTYDLDSMDFGKILSLLPSGDEFDGWVS